MTRKIIIDTDPGIDDAAAILLALASPELSVEALTVVFGNGDVDACTRNALTLLEIAKRDDVPVYMGVNKPLVRDVRYGYHVHGSNVFGDVEFSDPIHEKQPEHAVWALVDKVMTNPGEITLVALGPLTNVALALSIEPRIAQNVKELVLMGGAVLTHGNATQVASANLWYDPEAAAIVYRSGAPIVQAGLDVCHKIILYPDEFEKLSQAKNPSSEMLVKITGFLADIYKKYPAFARGGYVAYNDVPSIAYCIQPDLFDFGNYHVQISTHDELTKGQTVADVTGLQGNPPNAKVLMDVKDEALKELFIERVVNYQK